MRTYREALKDCLTEIDLNNGKKLLPIGFPYFVCSLCGLLVWQASAMIGSESPSAAEVEAILFGKNLLYSTLLHNHLWQFLNWLMNEPAEDDDVNDWDGPQTLAEKWNEFAELQRKERK